MDLQENSPFLFTAHGHCSSAEALPYPPVLAWGHLGLGLPTVEVSPTESRQLAPTAFVGSDTRHFHTQFMGLSHGHS